MFNEKVDNFIELAVECCPGFKKHYNKFMLEIPGYLKDKISRMQNFQREIVISKIDGSFLVMDFNAVSSSEGMLSEFYIKIDKVTSEADLLDSQSLYVQLPSDEYLNIDIDEENLLAEMIVLSKNDIVNKKKIKFSYNIVKFCYEYEMECFWYIENKGMLMKDKATKELSEKDISNIMCGSVDYNC